MKTPKALMNLKEILVSLLNQELFDDNWTWKHIHHLQRIRASYSAEIHVAETEKRNLLQYAQALLVPLECNEMRPKWTNTSYCPPAPYGKYHWVFQCEIVQEVLWAHPEFISGYRCGKAPAEPYRDANPHIDPARKRSWDCGYILGWNSKKVTDWCKLKNSTL